jgi:hypothetical protein
MSKNNTTTSEQIRAAMLAAYAAFRSAFPKADQLSINAQVYGGRPSVYGSALYGSAWTTSVGVDTDDIDSAIEALRSKLEDPAVLRSQAAALIKQAERIEGGAK